MSGWKVQSIEPMTLSRRNRLTHMYVLSPCVWAAEGGYTLLVRAVPRRDDEPRLKMAEIWRGHSEDGLHFDMDEAPVIWPGPDPEDLDGCEDPTVVVRNDRIRIWYTGFNQRHNTGRLMLARGPGLDRLDKAGVVLDSAAPFRNPKEAELVEQPDGRFRMFFEYADQDASLIGETQADDLDGPWEALRPSALQPRPEGWDSWHLSPGPVLDRDTDAPVMLYNGATRAAGWRIGWAQFDRDLRVVTDRCEAPFIAPQDVADGATDIAFAASLVQQGDRAKLYFSQSDQDLMCANLLRS